MTTRRRRRLSVTVLTAAMAIALTGCLQQANSGGGGAGLSGYVDNAEPDGDKVVTVLGAFGGAEKEAFLASIAAFESESGIDIQYTDDQDFTTTIKTRVDAGQSPDIAFFPQPGGLLELAAKGMVQPIDTYLDYNTLKRTLLPGFLDAANLNGRIYGAPMRNANKSIIWYPKEYWDAHGYQPPKDLAGLLALADQIKGDGITPWCEGWESDQATGWVGTDWIEQLVVTLYGSDVYNDWTSHRIPFDDPKVVAAFDEFGKIAKSDGMVYGGTRGIVNTSFAEAMFPAFDNPPKCMLLRQGNFNISFLPKDIQANLDTKVGIFGFPPLHAGESPPILGGGDLAALFNGNDPDAIEVMKFLTSDKFGDKWAQAGGWLSPHKTFDESNYPNEITKQIAEMGKNASAVVFDGSDVMPKTVGSGTFWTGMVDWVQGESSLQATEAIEKSWPQ